jgi:feruloyl esterase
MKIFETKISGTPAVLSLCLVPWYAAWATTADDCANLAKLATATTTIMSASLIPAAGALPEYCRIQGHVDTEVGFEVRLPTTWNGKLYFQGAPAFAGIIAGPGPGLTRGYAEATTDTGHKGGPPVPVLDGSWALNNPERQINFGYLAVHSVAIVAKQIVESFYGKMPDHSYFEGCSNGGRQALMEAQRYPTDFDGIIAGSPTFDYTGFMMGWNWDAQAQKLTSIPESKIAMIAAAVLEECDARDGLRDGLISDPRRCRFNPRTLQCPGADSAGCLTLGEVRTLIKVYGGPVNSDQEQLYPGLPKGHEDGADGWSQWVTGSGTTPPLQFLVSDGYLRFFVFGPAFDSLTFNFDTDPARVIPTGDFLNAANPDLSLFKANGGKLIMWNGWSDPGATPVRTVRYFLDIVDTLGEDALQFSRLFMAPGVHHCGGGPGPNTFDMLAPLENWVERGVAPDQIVASHKTGTTVDRTRPLCSYPLEAKYTGTGSTDDATNFVCRRPLDDGGQE